MQQNCPEIKQCTNAKRQWEVYLKTMSLQILISCPRYTKMIIIHLALIYPLTQVTQDAHI